MLLLKIPCHIRIKAYGDGSKECPSPLPCNECTAELLYNAGYRKQSEWISVDDKLPEDVYGKDRKQTTVLICTKSGKVRSSSRIKVRRVHFNREMQKLENTDIFEWSEQIPEKVTHWMPLPEPPKMKGGE